MSSPLPINQAEHGISTTPATNVSVLGSSPRSQSTPATAARKFYKRLLYDATVDAAQFSVRVGEYALEGVNAFTAYVTVDVLGIYLLVSFAAQHIMHTACVTTTMPRVRY